jgi:molybdopterin converting factor small subunit
MKIRVKFFATFKELFGGDERTLELGSQAGLPDLINILCDSRAECHKALLDDSGKLRRDIKLMKKGKDIEIMNETSQLRDGDVVLMFPTIFGG